MNEIAAEPRCGLGPIAGGLHSGTARSRDFSGLRVMRQSPLLDEALRYWTSLRQGAELPRRSALDPKEMRLIIGHSMILDQVRHGTVRVRLGGQSLERLIGMDVRGLPIRAFFDLADRARALDLFARVFEEPATLELDLISDAAPGGLVTGRMLVLPLLDAAGRPTKALAVLVTDRATVEPSRRFALTNSTLVPLAQRAADFAPRRRVEDFVPDVELPDELAPLGATGMAEARASFDGRTTQVPWLRVVK